MYSHCVSDSLFLILSGYKYLLSSYLQQTGKQWTRRRHEGAQDLTAAEWLALNNEGRPLMIGVEVGVTSDPGGSVISWRDTFVRCMRQRVSVKQLDSQYNITVACILLPLQFMVKYLNCLLLVVVCTPVNASSGPYPEMKK